MGAVIVSSAGTTVFTGISGAAVTAGAAGAGASGDAIGRDVGIDGVGATGALIEPRDGIENSVIIIAAIGSGPYIPPDPNGDVAGAV